MMATNTTVLLQQQLGGQASTCSSTGEGRRARAAAKSLDRHRGSSSRQQQCEQNCCARAPVTPRLQLPVVRVPHCGFPCERERSAFVIECMRAE